MQALEFAPVLALQHLLGLVAFYRDEFAVRLIGKHRDGLEWGGRAG